MIQFANYDEARAWVAGDLCRMVAHGSNLRGYSHVPPHHYWMANFLQGTKLRWINRAKAILGGRFLAKTYIGARQYLKWRWVRCPWMQFIVHSSNDKMAGRFVAAIKDEMRFDPLTAHMIPKKTASDYEFNLNGIEHEQGASIVCAGIKTSMTGSRADTYLFDDPEPDTEPEAFHDRILEAFGEAGDILHSPHRHLAKMVGPDGKPPTEVPVPERTQLIVLGQPHCVTTAYIPRPEDFDDDADGHPLIDAAFLIMPTTIRGKDPRTLEAWRWPEMAAQKYYNWGESRPFTPAEVSRSMPTSRWHLQHQINTKFMIGAGPVLKIKEIELCYKLPPHRILVIDPADSEEGCEWGVAVVGLIDHKVHVCYLDGFQGEAYEGDDWESMSMSVWRQIFDVAEGFGVSEVYLEKNLKAATTACRRYIMKNKVRMVVNEFAAKRNKKVRIPESLEPIINNRMMSAHPSIVQNHITQRQMVKLRWDRLPKPNDRIDVLAHAVDILVEEPTLFSVGGRDGVDVPPMPVDPSFGRVAGLASGWERIAR